MQINQSFNQSFNQSINQCLMAYHIKTKLLQGPQQRNHSKKESSACALPTLNSLLVSIIPYYICSSTGTVSSIIFFCSMGLLFTVTTFWNVWKTGNVWEFCRGQRICVVMDIWLWLRLNSITTEWVNNWCWNDIVRQRVPDLSGRNWKGSAADDKTVWKTIRHGWMVADTELQTTDFSELRQTYNK